MSASRPLDSQKTGSIKKLTQTKAYCPFCVFSHSWIKVAFKKAASSLPQVCRLLSRAKLHSFSNKHMKITKYFTLTILYPQKSICCQNNTIVKGKKSRLTQIDAYCKMGFLPFIHILPQLTSVTKNLSHICYCLQ